MTVLSIQLHMLVVILTQMYIESKSVQKQVVQTNTGDDDYVNYDRETDDSTYTKWVIISSYLTKYHLGKRMMMRPLIRKYTNCSKHSATLLSFLSKCITLETNCFFCTSVHRNQKNVTNTVGEITFNWKTHI